MRILHSALLVTALLPANAWAVNTLNVCKSGCPYSSIQSAVDAAGPGDTVSIGRGTFFENVRIVDKTLTLKGAGKDFTTLDGGFHDSVFHLEATNLRNPIPRVAIVDLTITHGNGGSTHGGGIDDLFATLYVQDVIVTSNRSAVGGAGISILGGDLKPNDIVRTVIAHNIASGGVTPEGVPVGWGGGLLVGIETTLNLTDSTVTRNSARNQGGGVYEDYHSVVVVRGSSITDNTAGFDGGGIAAGPIGGFAEHESTNLTIESSTLANNSAQHDGGGLYMIEGGANVTSTVFAHNSAGNNGAGAATPAQGGAVIGLTDSFIVRNQAGVSGGGVSGPNISLNSTTVVSNSPSNCDPAIGSCM